jgi:hypothetical protein
MNRFKLIYILFLITLIIGKATASETKMYTGIIEEVSGGRIELAKEGSLLMIGFSCAPKVCKTINQVKVGDEVLVSLGAVNNKNKLLSIKKCINFTQECNDVKELEALEEVKYLTGVKLRQNKSKQCRSKINQNLIEDNLYFPELSQDTDSYIKLKINEEYNDLRKKTKASDCLKSFFKVYRNAFFDACTKNNCGEDVGGGCYHIADQSITTTVISAAVKKCSI